MTRFEKPGHVIVDGYRSDVDSSGLFNLGDRQYWNWQDVRELDAGRADLQRFAQPGLNSRVTLTLSF